MSNAFKISILAMLLASSCSRALLSFEELETDVFVESRVKIAFSLGMDRGSVESLLSLKEDGKRIDAKIEWEKDNCFAQAIGGFKKGCKYTLSLQGDVYASDGRKYWLNVFKEFVHGEEGGAFTLDSFEERKNERGDVESLEFRFNKPVDAAMFEREFGLNPFIQTKKIFSEDLKRVEIIPGEKWKANEFYEWKIDNVFSQDGTKIFKECKGVFVGAKKEKAPKLLKVCPVLGDVFFEEKSLDDLLERQSIGFVFDCEINLESLERSVSFTPSAQGYWTKAGAGKYVFTPYKNYQIQKECLLCVDSMLEDVWGEKLGIERNFYFTLKNDYIKIQSASANGAPLDEEKLTEVPIEPEAPFCVKIVFSKFLDQKALLGIKSAIRLESAFPLSLENPKLDSIQIISAASIEFTYSNLKPALVGEDCVYKLCVKGGENFIFDAQNEYLKEDKCFYISARKKN